MIGRFAERLCRAFMLIIILLSGPLATAHAAGGDCHALLNLKLPNGSVTGAGIVSTGTFTIPGSDTLLTELPAFCRVTATVEPAIHIEAWMPVSNWNGKFNGIGLMGYTGAINYRNMVLPLRRGYAVASTDGGHSSGPQDTTWGLGHPQAIAGLGHRAHHEMTIQSRAIIRAYYGSAPRYAYFTGCSAGGWQALTEAQRYPDDYDGIVAGGPTFNLIHLHAGSLWNAIQLKVLPQEKIDFLHQAVLKACDANDGVTDGMIENPPACKFDPASLACHPGDTGNCLTPAEIASVNNITRGLRNSAGEQIYPGWPLSAAGGLGMWKNPAFIKLAAGTFKNLAFQGDPGWDVEHIDFDVDVPRADAILRRDMVSDDPDLRKFRQHGAKLILYHGWNDPLVSVRATIDYYLRVAAAVAPAQTGGSGQFRDFSRLFLGAGMGHCTLLRGPGPYHIDALGAIDRWVAGGQAPDKIIAVNPDTGISRPLCPYPQVARYKGSGSTADAGNFECVVPNR